MTRLLRTIQGGIKDISSVEKEVRINSTSEDSLFDDLDCLKNYLQKLNSACEALFQYPKRAVKSEDEVWYDNKPLGVNRIEGMMKEISKLASLSKIYTNHSVRATALMLWSNAQISLRHIMAISGHRSEASLRNYNTRPSSEQLRACSDILSGTLSRRPSQPSSSDAASSSENPPAAVNWTVVYSQNNTVQQFVKFQPQALSSLFANCHVDNVQEKVLFREMLYTNAARVPQDDDDVVWKNSYISPLFPRESIRSLITALEKRKHGMESPLLSTLNSADPGHMDESSSSGGRSVSSEHSAGFSDPFQGLASHGDQECAFCHSKSGTLKRCLGCKKVFYCGKTCQKKHWKKHKTDCKSNRKL